MCARVLSVTCIFYRCRINFHLLRISSRSGSHQERVPALYAQFASLSPSIHLFCSLSLSPSISLSLLESSFSHLCVSHYTYAHNSCTHSFYRPPPPPPPPPRPGLSYPLFSHSGASLPFILRSLFRLGQLLLIPSLSLLYIYLYMYNPTIITSLEFFSFLFTLYLHKVIYPFVPFPYILNQKPLSFKRPASYWSQ